MKDCYDLSSIIDINTFPWDVFYRGIAKSRRKASVFYGYDGATPRDFTTAEEFKWYKSLITGDDIGNMDVLLTRPKDLSKWNSAWYQLGNSDFWMEDDAMKNFKEVSNWIADLNIFQGTGRQIVFIQLGNSYTPPHVDQDLTRAPIGFRSTPEFIWLTNPNPLLKKELYVNGTPASCVNYFNSYKTHETKSAPGLRCSFRVDGRFTDEFRSKLKEMEN